MALTGFVVYEQGNFIVKTRAGSSILDDSNVLDYLNGSFLLFCEMRSYGFKLYRLIVNALGFLPKTHVYGVDIYYIKHRRCIFKNSSLFYLELNKRIDLLYRDLDNIIELS